jgi:hypothetical protein
MPEEPRLPPVPDALRANRPAAPKPPVDIFNDPFNPPPEPAQKPPSSAAEAKEEKEERASGLAEFDAPHAFASVLASGLGRVGAVLLTCMLTFGLTAACYRVSLIPSGWSTGGFRGFFGAIFAVPWSLVTGPGEWFTSLGAGITEPAGVPYLMLFLGGVILAIRSEIHIVRLMLFYAFIGAIHAAAYLKMQNPVSLLLWVGVLAGYIWLYRWYWRQQLQVEEEPEPEEE